MKYLLVALMVVVGLFLLRGMGRGRPSRPEVPPEQRSPRDPAQMVACAHCGVHVPRTEALSDDEGRNYCADEHRRAGPR